MFSKYNNSNIIDLNQTLFYDFFSYPNNPEELFTPLYLLYKSEKCEIYKAIYNITREIFCIKKFSSENFSNSNNNSSKNFYDKIKEETTLMKSIKHCEYILHYHGSYFSFETKNIYLIYEYIDGGSIFDFGTILNRNFTEIEIALIINDILHGLIYLHQLNITNNNIKITNILLTKEGNAKIGNFEKAFQKLNTNKDVKDIDEKQDFKYDILLIAIICLEMFIGIKNNFDRIKFLEQIESQNNKSYKLLDINKLLQIELDKIKSIELDNQIQITLSIAISADGNNNYEKYKSALSAMEIVLGRGGDQAVVRKDGKYKFYGGKTLEVEKRTRVKARTISHSISRVINDSDNIFIMGHKNIDIDAFGSALGMYRLCKTLEKDAYIVSEPKGKSLGKFLEILEKEEEYKDVIITEEKAKDLITENTLLIIVDTHKTSYVEFSELLEKIDKKIIIDHHRKAPDCIENALVSFHEVYASSAAELVTEIIQYSEKEVKLKLIEAESLYGGIMVDTKDFTFKTGVRTFEAAAYLRKYGVDIIRVKKWFQADLESYNIISSIVRNVEIHNNTIAISVFDEENEDANLICAKAADELLTISDITASFVMSKIGDKVFISGRSIGDINVQIILEKLGGGGHITLAGAQLEGFSLEEAKNELIIRINEYLLESE